MSAYSYKGKVNKNLIIEALDAYKTYKADREPLITRIRDNEAFYKMSYDRLYNGINETMACDTPFIFSAIENCRADAIDNYPAANIIERAPEGSEVAELLHKVIEAQLEMTDFKKVYKDNIRNKLKYGTAVYGVFYDAGTKNIDLKAIDILDVYVDMHIPDVEDSRFVFINGAVENDILIERYPEFSDLFTGDAQVETLGDTYSLKDRTIVTDCYYKTAKGHVHMMKLVGDTVIEATEDMNGYEEGLYSHGKYPVIFDTMYPCDNSPFGFGMIDIGKSTQVEINKLDNAITENILCGAKPRYLAKRNGGISEEEFCDLEKSIVHYEGDTDSIRAISHNALSESILTHRETKKEELKEILANRDFQQGGTTGGVTAASAIETLRQAGEKRSRAIIADSYDTYKAIIYMVIELMRQFFHAPRMYRICDSMGKKSFAEFSNSMMFNKDCPLEFDIDVTVQRENPYSRESINKTIMDLWKAGFIRGENMNASVIAIKNMQFDGKEKLIADLQELYKKENVNEEDNQAHRQ